VNAPTDDMKHSFYEELEYVFDQFPNYHMKILLGDVNLIANIHNTLLTGTT